MSPRPDSLSELALRSTDGRTFEYELADFLHEFALRGSLEMLRDAPVLLRDRCALGIVYDAYLAAVAAHLAAKLKFAAPRWTRDPERILRASWFAIPGRHMRALLLLESPAAFRERNLFVTANAIDVA